MALVLHYAIGFMAFPLSTAAPLAYRAAGVTALVVGAIIVYFGLAFLLGATNLSTVKRGLRGK